MDFSSILLKKCRKGKSVDDFGLEKKDAERSRLNVVVVIFDIFLDQDINRHIIDLVYGFVQY